MLKIAYCLYGQPRNFEKGFKIISKFIENYDVDFYYHTWTLKDENKKYEHSNYRNIDLNELKFENDIINKINLLYKPKAFISEISKKFNFNDYEKFINSLVFKNTYKNNKNENTFSCILSQLYSKQKVRDLLEATLNKENINYDLVILSRFDMLKEINIDLNKLNKKKFNVSNVHFPRHIFSDAILIMNSENFLKIINIFNNLNNILNNKEVIELVKNYNEKLFFVTESLTFANYLYYYNNLDNVEYINLPKFC